jgi:hypothetical protein
VRRCTAGRLADGGAYHDLKDLVFAQTRGSCGGDVLVAHPVGAVGHRVDQGPDRLVEPGVVEGGLAQLKRRRRIVTEDAAQERLVEAGDISHGSVRPSFHRRPWFVRRHRRQANPYPRRHRRQSSA